MVSGNHFSRIMLISAEVRFGLSLKTSSAILLRLIPKTWLAPHPLQFPPRPATSVSHIYKCFKSAASRGQTHPNCIRFVPTYEDKGTAPVLAYWSLLII